MTRDDAEDLDALIEIVDALCDTLTREPTPTVLETMRSIAGRARKLYRERVGETP